MDQSLHNKEGIIVYILIAKTPAGDQQELSNFTKQLIDDTIPRLREQTGISWDYHIGNVVHLDNTDTRQADEFLRDAFLRMVQTSCDVVLVVTDAALVVSTLCTFTGALGIDFHGRKITRTVSFFNQEP